jgi:alpha/beta hydrolase fold
MNREPHCRCQPSHPIAFTCGVLSARPNQRRRCPSPSKRERDFGFLVRSGRANWGERTSFPREFRSLSSEMADESRLEEPWFTNGDICLHDVATGPQEGPVVILLHGFPEFWYGWYNQIAPLADAGFRVIAPDQRGYNTSSKPAGIPAYKVSQLTSDAIAIVDQLG